jgi:glycosyltransferase involved in cell wall biosynthesis
MVPGTIAAMHIVHLETGRHLYGGARQALDLADGLQRAGVDATLVCLPGTAIAAAGAARGLTVRTLAMDGDLDVLFVRRFRRLLREVQPDLVHVHSRRGADTWGGIAARGARIPAVLTRRVDSPEGRLARWKYRHYDRVIAISEAIRRQLTGAGVPERCITVIPSAVDAMACTPAWTRAQLNAEFGINPGAMPVACVAQFIPRKGHATLLDAWPAVAAAVPGAQLLLFGAGPLEAQIRRRAADPLLGQSVRLAGFRPALREFLGRMELVVHPAEREGLGLAVLEAQAAGVPVVACRAGGVPEILRDGETGLLVPAGDATALATAIVALLRDPARRRAMGEAARAGAGRFAPQRMIEAHLTLYQSLLDTGRRDGR